MNLTIAIIITITLTNLFAIYMSLHIEKSHSTPLVVMDSDKTELLFEGRSVMENAHAFYLPILDSMLEELNREVRTFTLVFKLDYFNSTSSKYFLDIIRTAEKSECAKAKSLSVVWNYRPNDMEMKEVGQDIAELTDLPVMLKELSAQ